MALTLPKQKYFKMMHQSGLYCTARHSGQNSGLLNPVPSLKDNTRGSPSAEHQSTAADPCSWLRYINRDWLIKPQESALEVTRAALFSWTVAVPHSAGECRAVKTKGLNIWTHCAPILNTNRWAPCAARLSFEILKIHIFFHWQTESNGILYFFN